ncbi:MAG: alkaline phosphatase family protein [Gammaproteobacteria bacterium]|nr:alkaline phosphatase family protein [Gammaproteobacteria bacterium]
MLPVGPILYARGVNGARLRLAAQLVLPVAQPAPALVDADGASVQPEPLWTEDAVRGWIYRFELPLGTCTGYQLPGIGAGHFPVDTDFDGALRIGFVSCNGRADADTAWPDDSRNAMWSRLRAEHQRAPMQLLLQGGDQLYADGVLKAHAEVGDWLRGDPGRQSPNVSAAVETAIRRYYLRTYIRCFERTDTAWLMARVPSLMMWDDHDIVDGWGSLKEQRLDSPIGQAVFDNARRFFMRFQLGCAEHESPPNALDGNGRNLGWICRLPGFSVLAPDLRSERRPHRVLGEPSWTALERALAALDVAWEGSAERLLVLSSVPALGPRLSWLEHVARFLPGAGQYRDDLRDQWQSRAHREEWRRFLSLLVEQTARRDVTVLSGEIHLATRGQMQGHGRVLHQLVASGIAHPPPPSAFAFALGMLASLGENPLPGHPITLHPLPGRRRTYTNERNFLILERRSGRWSAHWETEHGGPSDVLSI